MDRLSRESPVVWVTRSRPAAEETAAALRAAGFNVLVDPVLETRDIPFKLIDIDAIGALAFTSANAVAHFARRASHRTTPVYAVGPATGRAAREAGFGDVREAAGDVVALAQFIADGASPAAPILHARAAEPAGDLVGELRRRGVAAKSVAIYETGERAPTITIAAGFATLSAVLLHSPRAAGVVGRLLAGAPARPRIVCLSPTIAEAFAAALIDPTPVFSISAAETPTGAALLALLLQLSPPP